MEDPGWRDSEGSIAKTFYLVVNRLPPTSHCWLMCNCLCINLVLALGSFFQDWVLLYIYDYRGQGGVATYPHHMWCYLVSTWRFWDGATLSVIGIWPSAPSLYFRESGMWLPGMEVDFSTSPRCLYAVRWEWVSIYRWLNTENMQIWQVIAWFGLLLLL